MNYCKFCLNPDKTNSGVCPECQNEISEVIPPHRLPPGTVLNDRYRIGKVLGEGGFGITYVGRDMKLDLKVAVKEYYPNGLANRNNSFSTAVNCSVSGDKEAVFLKFRNKFLQEARTLAMFSSEKSIVEVRDFFEANNTAYIIMEYLEGQDLRAHIKDNGLLTAEQAIQTLMPVMASLAKIHDQGLIHRDISPDNIILSPNGVKLLDFGAAREMTSQTNKSISVMLKPGYAPEEQYRGKGVQGPWTDVYAVCATIYKCITGVTPDDAVQRSYSDEVKTPSQLGFATNPVIESVIMKGMSVLQQDRYQDMRELMTAFSKAMKAASVTPPPIKPVVTYTEKTVAVSHDTSDVPRDKSTSSVFSEAPVKHDTDRFVSQIQKSQKKNNYLPFIIIGIVAVIAAVIGVAVVLSGDDKPDPVTPTNISSSTSDTTTPTTSPVINKRPSLGSAENVAEDLFYGIFDFDIFDMNNCEILEKADLLKVIDGFFVESTGASNAAQAYEWSSQAIGENIANAEDALNAIFSDPEVVSFYEETYGTDFDVITGQFDSRYLSEDEAQEYINFAKNEISSFSKFGLSASDIDWNRIEDYAIVEFPATLKGSTAEETLEYIDVLGYIDGEWKSIYFQEGSDKIGLTSLALLEGLLS